MTNIHPRLFPTRQRSSARGITTAAALTAWLVFAFSAPPASAQTFTLLYSFSTASQGSYPASGVIRDSAANLYGTTAFGGAHRQGNIFKLTLQRKLTTLYSFTGNLDGANPYSGLVRDSVGNLYGTTNLGGVYQNGVVFKLTPAGKQVVLYSFGAQANDGVNPLGLIMDAHGNLYGVTTSGGAFNSGTVYKLDTKRHETILYSFTGTNGDGVSPAGELVRDSAGNLYGTTYSGGYLQQGTVFKVEPNGTETILHTFLGGTDGNNPGGGLISDTAGNLYGTTLAPIGTVFKVDTSGMKTILITFSGQDGSFPTGRLAIDALGNLYGVTTQGGNNLPYGNVYKLDPAGNETVLYDFVGGKGGKYPTADPLALDAAGNLYGTAAEGGNGNNGVVFKIKP
jgi:uncharacterized repeat protein (TIGR03803 family)